MKDPKNTVTLYDAGGLFLLWAIFGLPLGIVFDYFWNLLVLSLALPRLSGIALSNSETGTIGKGKRSIFILLITLLGVVIDWAYVELIWDIGLAKTQIWAPAMIWPLQLLSIIIPIIMLWAVNFALSYAYLRLEKKTAISLGAAMAVFTAPWLLLIAPYALHWAA
jgi:hypothetical protein